MSTLVLTVVIIAAIATVVFVFKYFKTKQSIFFVNLALSYLALGLGYLLITGIQAPIEFKKEREYRYSYVINNLKDIRKAQVAYKDEKGVYASKFEDLIYFVNNDSMRVIRKLGTLPDTLTEQMAIDKGMTFSKLPAVVSKSLSKKLFNVDLAEDFEITDEATTQTALSIGFLIRDTIKISVKDTVFGADYHVDSLEYVPFSAKHAKFTLAAGEIVTASKIKIQVFEAVDTDPFDPNKVLKVGSLDQATNNAGNWE